MENSRQVLEPGEILSFLLTAAAMLLSALFFPVEYWLFIFLIIVDGFATAFRNDVVISVYRAGYALAVLVLGGIALRLSIIPMILETVSVIALVDLLFLVQRTRAEIDAGFLQNSFPQIGIVRLHSRSRDCFLNRIDLPRFASCWHEHRPGKCHTGARSRVNCRVCDHPLCGDPLARNSKTKWMNAEIGYGIFIRFSQGNNAGRTRSRDGGFSGT